MYKSRIVSSYLRIAPNMPPAWLAVPGSEVFLTNRSKGTAIAHSLSAMLDSAMTCAPLVEDRYPIVVQSLAMTCSDYPLLNVRQVIAGWPVAGHRFVFGACFGLVADSPLRIRRIEDVNGSATMLGALLRVRAANVTNKLRLWRMDAENLPPSFFVVTPDEERIFVHAACLHQAADIAGIDFTKIGGSHETSRR